jgi:diguanylate cyclase (GGDEF)-like protein
MVPRPDLVAFQESAYATELQRGSPDRWTNPALEAEYVRAHLLENRTLIRVACVFAALLAALRGVEQAVGQAWSPTFVLYVGCVLATSVLLASIAFTPLFFRLHLPVAKIAVPLRNAVVSIPVAGAAAHGQVEMLALLPLMILGPFFFLGLPFRSALLSVSLTAVSFVAAAIGFDLALPIVLRTCAFLLIAIVACFMAARHMERRSRTNFLQGRLIAELAQHDALTGTKNRRVLDEHLNRLWQQAVEDGRTIAVLLVDVDQFKAYNDRYGHQAGDQALRQVARTLQRFVCRPLDVLARYGGEEFAAVLYDVDGEQARHVAERMRNAVRELTIEHRASHVAPTITISVGVAVIEPTPERRPRGALQLADEALYTAKSGGRNRVELMDEAEYRTLVTGVFAQKVQLRSETSATFPL